VTVVQVSSVENLAELGVRWRDLEQRAAGSFFQSWTWVGCLAGERFPDPILVEATEDGRAVALGLFNRVRRTVGPAVLYLGESGSAELDCPYIEQNGVLAQAGREDELTALCLRTLASNDLVLSGVGEPVLAAVKSVAGLVRVTRSQASPYVDLARLRATGADYLAARSANTRQQIRRSDRLYQRDGPIQLERASSVEAANTMLDQMASLHQAVWIARGQPGSFARPFFRRFHQELIAAAMPRGELALLKILCDDTTLGILYNFVYRGRMSAYQSGFAYRTGDPHAKPGLSCHHRAIQFALAEGLDVYDFLAGEDRYKRSLADLSHQQIWLTAGPVWSPRLLLTIAADAIRRPGPRRTGRHIPRKVETNLSTAPDLSTASDLSIAKAFQPAYDTASLAMPKPRRK
jgi:CelD/BcsL family acetyltransferase involved in cellulose biosynthesis